MDDRPLLLLSLLDNVSFDLVSLAPRTGRGGGDLNVKLPVVAAACHMRRRSTGDTDAELKSFSNSSLSLGEPVGMNCAEFLWCCNCVVGVVVVVVVEVVGLVVELGGGGGGARAGIFSLMAKLRSGQTYQDREATVLLTKWGPSNYFASCGMHCWHYGHRKHYNYGPVQLQTLDVK